MRKVVFVVCIAVFAVFLSGELVAQQSSFDGIYTSLSNLFRLSHAKSRSISPENFTGEKGKGGMATEGTGARAARELGQGWKVSPSIRIQPMEVCTLAEIEGPGAIQQIWMTPTGHLRYSILRFYWDGETEPSIEVPVCDFFANGWGKFSQVSSLAVCVNPGSGFNCYWIMPFRKSCKITMENLDEKEMTLYYQINYTLTEVPDDAAYLHAQFRRSNPLEYKTDHVILDGVKGWGHYVGTFMNWGTNNNGWWGEGEIKFFMDGDREFPTICGTGTEDYFCGSYCFIVEGKYRTYTTPYAGFHQVIVPDDGLESNQKRFSMYRWHITDPIRFENDLKVTIQALGWRSGGRYLPLQDDISSVAYWYQQEPHAPFPELPDKDYLEIR